MHTKENLRFKYKLSMCLIKKVSRWFQLCLIVHSVVPNASQETAPEIRIPNGARIIGTVNYTEDQNKQYFAYRGIPYVQPPIGDLRFRQKTAPEIRIPNGARIIGTVNYTEDQNKQYFAYRGIPYAQPPIGDLRFRPPQPLTDEFSETTISAVQEGSVCVQPGLTPTVIIGSEDCLYINVYIPQVPNNSSLLPVMVWIHGGGFRTGSGNYDEYGPDYFLNENVIIVTLNYRLGIFGFFSTGDAASPGNQGIKDQLAGLKWVQKNIQSFGGDPQQATLFGESAGAASVSYLSQAPLAEGLFRSVILQSGTSVNLWALTRNAKMGVNATITALNLTFSTSEALVEKMRRTDFRVLQSVAATAETGDILIEGITDGLFFGPVIEIDHPEAIIVNKSHEQLKQGLYHRIPYIIGYNSLEGLAFSPFIPLLRLHAVFYVPLSLNIPGNNRVTRALVDARIKSRYGSGLLRTDDQVIQLFTDDQFVRPILEATRLYSQNAPVYLYRFSYEGSRNRTRPGVGHAEENMYLWRITPNPLEFSPSDWQTRYRLVRLWTQFAKTGNPTPTATDDLLENVVWPLANSAGSNNTLSYLDIGPNLLPLTNPDWNTFQFWVNLFNEYGRPPYSTY